MVELKEGDLLLSSDGYGILGRVKYGHWINQGILSNKEGIGLYVDWDDGDHSCIGIEYLEEGDYTLIPKEEECHYL